MERPKHTRTVSNILLACLFLLGFFTSAAHAKPASVLLQEGLYAEEIDGDLDAAISIYEQVIARAEAAQQIAAQATFRIAMCHLKRGEKQKAAEYFRDVISKYPKQKPLGAKAREQLSRIRPAEDIIADSFVIHYRTVDPAKDGLTEFNKNHPRRVRTHHAGRYRQNGQTINTICTDTEAGKDRIVSMLNSSDDLVLIKVVPPKSAAPAGFGPVIERTVNDDGEKENSLIDFDSGQLFTPPAALRDTDDFGWITEKGIDAMGESAASRPGLYGFDMAVIPLANARWDGISAKDLTAELSIAKPGTPVVMSAKGDLPATYMFKTREGGMGVVQILQMQVNARPRNFKIRYKMLQEQVDIASAVAQGDPAKAVELMPALYALFQGAYKAVDGNDLGTALMLTRKLLQQRGTFEAAVRGTAAQAGVEGGFEMLEMLADALEKKDAVHAKSLLEGLNSMGPALQLAVENEAQRQQKSAASFGPVRELVVRSLDENPEDSFIDFETGRVFTPPEELRGSEDDAQLKRWIDAQGIDAGGILVTKDDNVVDSYLRTRDMLVFPLREQWDIISPADLQSHASDAERDESSQGVHHELGGKAWGNRRIFGFKTAEGGLGVLQIVGVTDSKDGLKIRYKMVQEPYTQKLYADIAPDGTLNFETTVRMVNESGSAVETTSFVNSDFVKVTAMRDGRGRPIQFTTAHQGDHWRYHVTFNEPVAPGGMMVYSQEGTMSGLIKTVPNEKDTFRFYMRHYPSAGRPTLRIETYLLPQGAELLSTTPADMQRREKDGRIELHVEETIPPGGGITTAFKYRLPGAQLAQAKPLELIPAPFFDGEVMRLKLSTPVGAEIGQVIYATEVIEQQGQYPWRIQSYMHIAATNMEQYTEVYADRMTLAPMSSRTKNWLGDFRARYGSDSVKLTSKTAGGELTKDFVLTGRVYDNEQALYVIRSLPLKAGYSASFDIFPVQSGIVSECRIRVTGTEKLTFTAGEIECFAIELSVYAQGIKALTHHLWISTDEHHWLVKYDSGTAVMELIGTGRRDKDQPEKVIDPLNGYSFTVPYGWYHVPSQGQHKVQTQLLPPELKCWAAFIADERPALVQSVRKIAEGDIERVKGFFKNYTVRADSWIECDIGGLPAAQYVADYEDKDLQMSEYRTYILGESLLYWFVFRIQRDQFDQNRPEFDSIINSFGPAGVFGTGQQRLSENLAAEGWRLWQERKLSEAEQKFKEALEKDPMNADAWNGLGWSQFNQGKPLNAKVSFEKCLEIEPTHAAALNGLGWIAKGEGKTDDAIGYWQKAVAATPTATAALNGLALTYMERKQYDQAIKYYEMWLKAEPDNADAKEGLKKAKSPIDLTTPEATIKSFVNAVYNGNLEGAKACVSKEGADYDEFMEMLATESNHPFQAMIKAMDASIPIEITSKDITEDRCKIKWHFTLGRVYYIGDTKIEKGTHQEFSSYLELVGDKWLIRDI